MSSFPENTEIPSESLILATKQKREHIRQTKTATPAVEGEEDFIALSVSRKEDVYQGPHPESRLMREDDDLGEGDDGMFYFDRNTSYADGNTQNLLSIWLCRNA